MKKNILITLIILLILALIFLISSKFKDVNNDETTIKKDATDLTPISKDNAIKVIKSEFGDNIINTVDDIKEDGDYYIVDVNMKINSSEEHNHTEDELSTDNLSNSEDEIHIMNLGIQKVNKYTGELE